MPNLASLLFLWPFVIDFHANVFFFLACEPPLKRRKFGSKVSALTEDDDTRMRRFVAHVTYRPAYWRNSSVHVCQWEGVNCDERMRIFSLLFDDIVLKGNLTWHVMPVRLSYFAANVPSGRKRNLHGTIPTASFPASLEFLAMSRHAHTGPLDLSSLPEKMELLQLSCNSLSGNLQFGNLPQSVEGLNLHGNSFKGNLLLDSLPRSLTDLDLGCNLFEGDLSLSLISPYLHRLNVRNNLLSGSLALGTLPPNIELLRLDTNDFNGTITLESLPASIKELSLQSNKLTGFLNLMRLPDLISLNVRENLFFGVLDLKHLPDSLEVLNLSRNQFSGYLDLYDIGKDTRNLKLDLRDNLFEAVIYHKHKLPKRWIEQSVPRLSMREYLDKHFVSE